MKNRIAIVLGLISLSLISCITVHAQAKKPTLMVIPSNVWCVNNGYVQTFNDQGTTNTLPDYEAALNKNMDLVAVITKIGELMTERGFPLQDLSSVIRSVKQTAAEDEVTTSKSGSALAESPLDRLNARAKADILLELTWNINTVGPKKSVTYTLSAKDAYTNKQVAAAQGTGQPSFSAETPVLLEEAVVANMDAFTGQLMTHFEDLQANGREVVVRISVFDNTANLDLETEFKGVELQEIIEDWMAQSTVNHRYSLLDATEKRATFDQVRIPLYKENGMPCDTRSFVDGLRKYLRTNYQITSKLVTKGLGRAELILGDK